MSGTFLTVKEGFDAQSREQQEAALDAEVEAFSRYMQGLSDWKAAGPLHAMERALLKTYLVAKVTGKLG